MMQSSLDQALDLLQQHQAATDSGIGTRDARIMDLESKHQQLLNGMMDNVLDTCIRTVSDQLYLLEGGGTGHKVSAEYIMSLLEVVHQKTNEFAASMVQLVNGGDPKNAIDCSASLAQAVAVFLRDGKEIERFADEKKSKEILEGLRSGAESTISFFKGTQSAAIGQVPMSERPTHIVNLSREIQMKFSGLSPLLESMVNSVNDLTGDIANQVDSSMKAALEAVNAASLRIQSLIQNQGNANVHAAILQAANAITSAIAMLIKCATASQLEIAATGQSTSSFYKKNSKWTQGLISAANSVSDSTVNLVNNADGLVNSKNSWEEVVVAAQDVGVSTTQLVSAARVKASLYSKTQQKLELAATNVRDATKLLVKAAQDASQLHQQQKVDTTVAAMTKHEAKVMEMEQQVKILELEKQLGAARYALGAMRRAGYRQE